MSNAEILPHEHRQKLIRDIESLRQQLRCCLEEWFHITQVKKKELLEQYDSYFREQEIIIQKKSLELSILQRRVELFMIKIHRGEKLTNDVIHSINYLVDKEYALLNERMNDIFSPNTKQVNNDNTHESEIPKLYRVLAKKLHPDYNTETDYTKKLWESTQNAYKNKDVRILQSLYEVIIGKEEVNHNVMDTELSLEALEQQKRKLENKLVYETKKLKKILSQEPFTLEKQLNDEIWISFHRLELQKEIDNIDGELQLNHERYKSIVGEKYSSVQEQSKETILFEQKFSDTTYFGQR
jgi:hypothetical protein